MSFKYLLKCRDINSEGLVVNGTESLGFPYEDLVNEFERPDFQYFVEQDYLKIAQPVKLNF